MILKTLNSKGKIARRIREESELVDNGETTKDEFVSRNYCNQFENDTGVSGIRNVLKDMKLR